MSASEGIELVVAGRPVGKGRPRFHRASGRVYADATTVSAEERIRGEWMAAGRPRLEGPLEVVVLVVLARPKAHLLVNGELSAEGKRHPVPVRKPDVDNVLKLVCDALNGLAYVDDAQIVAAQITRRWGEPEATGIRVREHDYRMAALRRIVEDR